MAAILIRNEGPSMELRLHEMVDAPGGGRIARPRLEVAVLRNGVNEVDADFWAAWFEANKDSSLLAALSRVYDEENR